jgi:hypothetical protein
MGATETIAQVNFLADSFAARNTQMKALYKLLRMDDENEHEDMESFVGNDPRTLWNMVTHLLIPRPLQFQLRHQDGSAFERPLTAAVQRIEEAFGRYWTEIDRHHARRGRMGFFRNFIGLFAATGWYFVPFETRRGLPWVDFWNPYNVYVMWGEDTEFGIIQLARKRTITYQQALLRARTNGWILPQRPTSWGMADVTEYQLWTMLTEDTYSFTTVMNLEEVMPSTVFKGRIQVSAGVAGGLPDAGVIDNEFPAHLGEAVLATNMRMYENQNRQQSWIQQMIRDTANPRWFERSSGQPILRPGDMFKRGAVFRGGINDDIRALDTPPIPVEARTSLFDVRNMIQRGGLSDLTFGNIQQVVSSVLISQAAESAVQLIGPFQESIIAVTSDVSNAWLQDMIKNPSLAPSWFKDLPSEVLEDVEIRANYAIQIPGDLQSRVLLAKSINPDFTLQVDTLYDMFFPEVANKSRERSGIRADLAERHPTFQLVTLIGAYDMKAQEADQVGNTEMATLYRALSAQAKQQAMQSVSTSTQPVPESIPMNQVAPGAPVGGSPNGTV